MESTPWKSVRVNLSNPTGSALIEMQDNSWIYRITGQDSLSDGIIESIQTEGTGKEPLGILVFLQDNIGELFSIIEIFINKVTLYFDLTTAYVLGSNNEYYNLYTGMPATIPPNVPSIEVPLREGLSTYLIITLGGYRVAQFDKDGELVWSKGSSQKVIVFNRLALPYNLFPRGNRLARRALIINPKVEEELTKLEGHPWNYPKMTQLYKLITERNKAYQDLLKDKNRLQELLPVIFPEVIEGYHRIDLNTLSQIGNQVVKFQINPDLQTFAGFPGVPTENKVLTFLTLDRRKLYVIARYNPWTNQILPPVPI